MKIVLPKDRIEQAAEILYSQDSSRFMAVWKEKDGWSDNRLGPIRHVENVIRALNGIDR